MRTFPSTRVCKIAWAVAIVLIPLASHPIDRESSLPETLAPTASTASTVFTASTASAMPAAQGVTTDWWTRAQADIARREYEASVSGLRLQAPNRAQGFRSIYGPERIAVEPRQVESPTTWSFTWRTARWGRPQAMHDIEPPSGSPIARGSQVTYTRPGLCEWYENRREGLEQGFTIAERPAGRGQVAIDGEIGGGLRAHLHSDGTAVDLLDERGECVLRYSHLLVSDAGGREVPSSLAASDHGITILIEDGDARYPLTVDPILTTPSWTAESNQASSQFGATISTAGDVNGDGFSDVIVGAIGYDNGQTDEGRAFLYLGSPAGLGTNPAWSAESNQAGSRFGLGVATAGDVNGDGFADLIIGAYTYDNGQTDEGRAYVYHGSAQGPGSVAAWTAESNQASSAFGRAVGTAGDVNRDGFDDVIVTAYLFDNGQGDEGRAYVYLGSASGLGAAPAWMTEGDQAGAGFGSGAGTAGDVNADGYADVVVGAYLYDNVTANIGRVSLYFGSGSGLATTAASAVESDQAVSQFGYSTGTAGDVDGDGYADVIVGAPRYTNGQSVEGRVYVYRGSVAGIAFFPWTSEPNEANAQWGFAVGTAGDVNGDSYADIIIGAPFSSNGQVGEGLAAVQQGSPSGPVPLWGTWSDQANARFGIAVGTAGDVNGDGLSDVIVGADFFDNGQADEGRAFVYHGTTTGLSSDPGWTAESNQGQSLFGGQVASAGDLNGDGYSDAVVGAPKYDHGEDNEGQVLVYFGSRDGLSPLPGWAAESNEPFALFGASVSTAGDVNGDGFSDLIVGAAHYPTSFLGAPGNGKAYVYHGSPAGLGLAPDWTAEADAEGTEFGLPSCTAGDVNGDGYSDVIIGAHFYGNGEFNEGRAFIYEGSAAGLQAEPAWAGESNQAGAHFGRAVSGAGDVNGDGYSDILVSAILYDNGQVDEGRVFLYAGSPSGPGPVPAWTFESNQSGSLLGDDLSSAGDVNGDGFSDVVIGASNYANGQQYEGRAYLFQGSATGLASAPNWTVESDQEQAFLGASVSTAGDVNGDGFSEVLIGAPDYNSSRYPSEGGAFLYLGSSTGLAPNYTWSVNASQEGAGLGSSVALAGDVNGDGFSDIILGAPDFDNGQTDEGLALLYYGNGGDGPQRIPRQAQADGSAPIDLLGRSNSLSSFRVNALGRTAAGRGLVQLEVEVEPAGTPFDGEDLRRGPLTDTGRPTIALQPESIVPLSVLAGGLAPSELYHWRLRTRSNSPFFPSSPWLSMPLNSVTEADVRTVATIDIADLGVAPRTGAMLAPSAPNPFQAATRVAYQLPASGEHRLAIYDVQGRVVRVLATGLRPAGHQAVSWDGRDARGEVIPAGVYFVRLDFGGRTETGKVVMVASGR